MRLTLSAAVFGLLVAASPAFAGEDAQADHQADHQEWVADFDKAMEIAKKDNKMLLVDFTGSDWCGWCIKLHEEVFAHKQFLDAAKSKYVLVALDFPKSEELKAKVPNPERNTELKNKYAVRGFPTILVLTADGELILRTGYRPGGPEKYVAHLGASTEAFASATKLAAAWAAADDASKDALMKQACDVMEKMESQVAAAKIKDIVIAAYESDADNAKGLRALALKGLLGSGNATPEMVAVGNTLDPKNELGIRELCVNEAFKTVRDKKGAEAAVDALAGMTGLGFKDSELAFNMYFRAMDWCNRGLQNKPMAVKFADAAKKIGTDNEQKLNYIQKVIDENKPAS